MSTLDDSLESVDDILERPGLSINVAKSMLAAVVLGKANEVSPYLWMRLLNTYIDLVDAVVDRAIDEVTPRARGAGTAQRSTPAHSDPAHSRATAPAVECALRPESPEQK